MGNTHHTRYQRRAIPSWRVLKDNQRQLPCHPSIRVRIKYLEPGIQSRWCDRCQTYRYFILEPVSDPRMAGVLRLRWLTDTEATEHEERVGQVLRLEDVL